MQCNSSMGLMPIIKRAWLTIDSTIYIWNYEDGLVPVKRSLISSPHPLEKTWHILTD